VGISFNSKFTCLRFNGILYLLEFLSFLDFRINKKYGLIILMPGWASAPPLSLSPPFHFVAVSERGCLIYQAHPGVPDELGNYSNGCSPKAIMTQPLCGEGEKRIGIV